VNIAEKNWYKAGTTMDRQLNIAIAFDRNYLRPVYALLASLFAAHPSHTLSLHIIATGLTNPEQAELTRYGNSTGTSISFYNVDETLVNRFVLNSTWTPAVYYRLFFPLLVPASIERLLYIDTDTIVVRNLTDLCHENLESFPMGAVYDCYVKTQPLIGVHDEGEYFNSGVLLIDLKRWREQKISARAMEYLSTFPERIRFVDQCALNAVLQGNWKKLPEKYNLLYSYIPEAASKQALKKIVDDSFIIHFTLHRPWHMLGRNRLAYLYHQFLEVSPLQNKGGRYNDFSLSHVPQFFWLKLSQLYFDIPGIAWCWRKFKSVFR
jgi:lipopolysaccharide biosynthesis glycosyltransferase